MRRTAAIVFLAIMVLNGAVELAMAAAMVGPRPAPAAAPRGAKPVAKAGCCAGGHAGHDHDDDGPDDETTSGSASGAPATPRPAPCEVTAPPTTVVCTCKCCGPVCRMGADCRCGAPKFRVTAGGPMFFHAPSCHPGDGPDPITGTYMPGSLQYRFLTAVQPGPGVAMRIASLPESVREGLVERPDSPPVPPPQRCGCARAKPVSIA